MCFIDINFFDFLKLFQFYRRKILSFPFRGNVFFDFTKYFDFDP